MTTATATTTRVFGTLAGLAGIEHGVGELLQGSVRPDGLTVLSWPDSEFFSIVSGEPALTVVPHLLLTGVLAILVSVTFIAWALVAAGRRRSGAGLLVLSAVLLSVGGGFGPPLLGALVGATAARAESVRLRPAHRRLPAARRLLAATWPWALAAAIVAWLLLMPGLQILSTRFGVHDERVVVAVIASAMGLLVLSLVSGLARDRVGAPVSAEGAGVLTRTTTT